MGRAADNAEDFVIEIVEALTAYGGAAHRQLVLDQVAIALARRGARLPANAANDLQQAFERHLQGRGQNLFRLPFGEGSHRWALAAVGT